MIVPNIHFIKMDLLFFFFLHKRIKKKSSDDCVSFTYHLFFIYNMLRIFLREKTRKERPRKRFIGEKSERCDAKSAEIDVTIGWIGI